MNNLTQLVIRNDSDNRDLVRKQIHAGDKLVLEKFYVDNDILNQINLCSSLEEQISLFEDLLRNPTNLGDDKIQIKKISESLETFEIKNLWFGEAIAEINKKPNTPFKYEKVL